MQTEVYWTTEALVNSVIQFSFSKTAHNKELQMNYLTLSIHCLENLISISGYDTYIFPDSVETQWKILDSIGSHL